MVPLLKEGDKVYLLTKNLRIKRQTKKLDYVKVGPFLVNKVVRLVNYRLVLLPDVRIYPVFYISKLEPVDAKTPYQESFYFEPEVENEFEVKKILDKKGQRYLIKQKGYDESENTQELKRYL